MIIIGIGLTSIGKLMELIKVNEENFNEIIALKTKYEKLGYVDSALYSIAECFLDYSHMDAFGIYNGDEFIGFTSIFAKDNFGQIINFFIKDKFQNKTYGTRAVETLLQLFKDRYKVDFVSVGIYRENKRAFGFWKRLGFIDTGNIEGDYCYYRKPIARFIISDSLYLIKYLPAYQITLTWYQDRETVKMVDNADYTYSFDDLKRMYTYLSNNGDLFYIAYPNKLIGDCAIFDDNMVAIVISKEYRGRDIGSKVLNKLISYAREKGLAYLKTEIYDFNHISRKLFYKFGFKSQGNNIYKLDLKN